MATCFFNQKWIFSLIFVYPGHTSSFRRMHGCLSLRFPSRLHTIVKSAQGTPSPVCSGACMDIPWVLRHHSSEVGAKSVFQIQGLRNRPRGWYGLGQGLIGT